MIIQPDEAWLNLVNAFKTNDQEFPSYIREFKLSTTQWLEYLREKLFSKDRVIAFSILNTLTDDELIILFDVLVVYAGHTHGSTKFFRDLIIRLPREWVIKNIEASTGPILAKGTEDEYRRIMELYYMLHSELTYKLASHAANSNDPAIRDVGNDFLHLLMNSE